MDVHVSHSVVSVAPDVLVGLQAVAEPTRARIVALLGHGEHCVCDIAEMLGVSTALASHHLRTLLAGGLLRERRSGRWVYYSLDIDRVAALRTSVTAFLSPTDAAVTPCPSSECGPTRSELPRKRPLRTRPLLEGTPR